MILDGVWHHLFIHSFESDAALGDPLLPSCIEQPEGGLSSVAFRFLSRWKRVSSAVTPQDVPGWCQCPHYARQLGRGRGRRNRNQEPKTQRCTERRLLGERCAVIVERRRFRADRNEPPSPLMEVGPFSPSLRCRRSARRGGDGLAVRLKGLLV